MRTIASVGCWIAGSGCSSTRTSRLPCQVTAFMDRACPVSGPVTLLELLAAPAPAGVVAAELLVLVDSALLDHRSGLLLLDAVAVAAVGARLVVERAAGVLERRRAARGLLQRHAVLAPDLDLDVVDHAREVGPDRVHQVLEEREGLVLVRDDRLDLGEPAQVDALAQVVHVVEVLAPARVDELQQQVALDCPHDLVAELALTMLVELDH